MSNGDRWFIFSCTLFIVGIVYLVNDEYVYWLVYMILALVARFIQYKCDKEEGRSHE